MRASRSFSSPQTTISGRLGAGTAAGGVGGAGEAVAVARAGIGVAVGEAVSFGPDGPSVVPGKYCPRIAAAVAPDAAMFTDPITHMPTPCAYPCPVKR